MKTRFLIMVFWALDCLLFFPACKGNIGTNYKLADELTAMVWNVQNLFDGEEAGDEYADFREGSGWTQEKYKARLLSISQGIIGIKAGSKPQVPDIIGLIEVENSNVLEDLAKGHLLEHGFIETFFGRVPGMATGIGVLSRLPLEKAILHSITVNGETSPRPMLEVHVEAAGEQLVFFVCHWKSKLGGDNATEHLRRASSRIVMRRVLELKKEKPGVPVIVMGDLNVNHDEFYRRGSSVITALMPDSAATADMHMTASLGSLFQGSLLPATLDFLVLSNNKPPRPEYFDAWVPVFYSAWENELQDGSYFYRDNWETIDHILMTEELFDQKAWDLESIHVLNDPPFVNSNATPNSYNQRTGFGLSDHLPLVLVLRLAD